MVLKLQKQEKKRLLTYLIYLIKIQRLTFIIPDVLTELQIDSLEQNIFGKKSRESTEMPYRMLQNIKQENLINPSVDKGDKCFQYLLGTPLLSR